MVRKFIYFKICPFKHRRNFLMEALSCLGATWSINNPNCKNLIIYLFKINSLWLKYTLSNSEFDFLFGYLTFKAIWLNALGPTKRVFYIHMGFLPFLLHLHLVLFYAADMIITPALVMGGGLDFYVAKRVSSCHLKMTLASDYKTIT